MEDILMVCFGILFIPLMLGCLFLMYCILYDLYEVIKDIIQETKRKKENSHGNK